MGKAKTKAKAPGTRKRRGVRLEPTQLAPPDVGIEEPTGSLADLAEKVRGDGGAVLASYREPLGGHALLFVALPVERIEPTPYQREVSDAHVRRLTVAMDKTKRFLDPLIVVRDEENDRYLTPNGNHRLTALKELGAKTAIALLVPEHEVAYQILALNIEKAYNLREKAIEVVRLYRELSRLDGEDEESYALEFEEPALITLGFGSRNARGFPVGRTSRSCARSSRGKKRGWPPVSPSESGAPDSSSISTTPSAKRSKS